MRSRWSKVTRRGNWPSYLNPRMSDISCSAKARSLVLVSCERHFSTPNAASASMRYTRTRIPRDLVDEGTAVADRGDRTRDGFLLLQQVGGHVEVEAVGSDDRAALVLEAFADDDDFARSTLHVDDPVAGAEGPVCSKDVIQRRRQLSPVVGMLVGQDKAGGRGDRSGFVAVDAFDLGGPFPTFVGEVEAPGADGLRCPAGDGLLDGHAVGGVG
jgi:hypothetical protein